MASKLALRSKVALVPDSASTRKCATPVDFSQKTKTFLTDSRFFPCGNFGNARIFFKIALPKSRPPTARQSLDFTKNPQRNCELTKFKGTNHRPSEDCERRAEVPEAGEGTPHDRSQTGSDGTKTCHATKWIKLRRLTTFAAYRKARKLCKNFLCAVFFPGESLQGICRGRPSRLTSILQMSLGPLGKSLFLLMSAAICAAQIHGQVPAQMPGQLPGTKLKPPLMQVPSGATSCSVVKTCADLAPAMIQSALGKSPLEQNLRYLTDSIGGRMTGTTEAHRAAEWALQAFRSAGVDEVHTEEFTIPTGWREGQTAVEVLSPSAFPVRLASLGWSPPTPQGGLEADVVDAGAGDDNGFAKAGMAAHGAIVLVHTNLLVTWADLLGQYKDQPAIVDRAVKAGAAAIFWMSGRPNLILYRHMAAFDGGVGRLPEAIVAREDAERMARLLDSGQRVRVHLEMPNLVSGPVEAENVVAEIRGYEMPDDYVLLGAHLDSWDLGTGALDDGCNAAMVIDAARVIHSSGNIPRRSIRFVLFSGEDQGMLGSYAYAGRHREQLDRMAAAVIFDGGDGAVTGYSLGGRQDALAAVRETLEPVKSLGVKEFTLDADIGTDNFDFLLAGIPTLVANQEPASYLLNYHAASDTFDKVDIGELKKHVAIAAVTAYALADREGRIAPRQSRGEVEELMSRTAMGEEMRIERFTWHWETAESGSKP